MGKGKESGFSAGGMTIQQKAEAYAQAQVASKSYDLDDYDKYAFDNLPEFVKEKLGQAGSGERYAASVGDPYVKRETEKAVLIGYRTDYGNLDVWAPKSVILTPEKAKANDLKSYQRQYVNDSYYNYLRNTAKAAGVKLGSVKKWDKIKKKLTQSGVSFLDRDAYASSTG